MFIISELRNISEGRLPFYVPPTDDGKKKQRKKERKKENNFSKQNKELFEWFLGGEEKLNSSSSIQFRVENMDEHKVTGHASSGLKVREKERKKERK